NVVAHVDASLFLWKKEGLLTQGDPLSNPVTSDITKTSAVNSVTFDGEGGVFDLTLFYGTTDGRENPSAWAQSVSLGVLTNQPLTNLTVLLENLVAGDMYYTAWRASNCVETTWTNTAFETPIEPLVSPVPGAFSSIGAATLNATLFHGHPADLAIYWGDTDGQTNVDAWEQAVPFSSTGNGTHSVLITGLLFGVEYVYRPYATNALGESWATNSISFTTLDPGTSITELPVSDIGATSAVFNALVAAPESVFEVFVYWGDNDAGVSTNWDHMASLGWVTNQTTMVTHTVHNLMVNQAVYYTFEIRNAATSKQINPALVSFTQGSPQIENGAGATFPAANQAVLNGELLRGVVADVTVFWGDNDARTNAAAWDHQVQLGELGLGAFSTVVSGVVSDVTYYYQVFASNEVGTAWASQSSEFVNLFDPRIGLLKLNACGYDRTSTLTNFPLLVELSTNLPGFRYDLLASAEGYDLRFWNSNRTVALDYEIDTWNPGG
ncbi:MAG: hypothetical protein AAF492_21775, partial [Verrucomicrobiota bacterium]